MNPGLLPEVKLNVDIAWRAERGEYCLDIRRGSKSKRLWLKPSTRFDEIIEKANKLSPPLIVDGECGLNGVGYSLDIGAMPQVSFRWWMKIPKQWESVGHIAEDLEQIGDETIPPDANV